MKTTDLDVDVPSDVALVLEWAAQKYRESRIELQSAWQDKNAGKVWDRIAKALEATARKVRKIAEEG